MTAYRIRTKHGPSPLGAVWRAEVQEKRRFGWRRARATDGWLVPVGLSASSEADAVANARRLFADPTYPQDFGPVSHDVSPTWERGEWTIA